jgi:DNA-binding GntR family transcriptional regulator
MTARDNHVLVERSSVAERCQSVADHELIVAALSPRDGEAAARAMAQNMRNVCNSTREAMEKAP